MTAPNAERRVRYLLELGLSPDAEAMAQRLAEIIEGAQKEATDVTAEESDRRQRIERERLKELEAEYEKHSERLQRLNREFHDGVIKTGEGLVMMGRGFAELGIAGEKDVEKLLRMLVKVQAAVDIAKGAIDLYRGIATAVESYRAAVVAVTEAETALAAVRALTGSGGGVVRGPTGNRQIAGSFVNSVTAGASEGLIETATTSAASVPLLGKAIAGLGAAITSMPALVAAAVGSSVAATLMATNAFGARDYMASGDTFLGGDTSPEGGLGYFLGTISGGHLAREQRHALGGKSVTDRMGRERRERLMMREHQEAGIADRLAAERQMIAMQSDRRAQLDALREPSQDEAENRANMALVNVSRQRNRLESAMGGDSEATIADAQQRYLDSLNEAISLRQRSLEIARKTKQEEIDGSKEAIRGLEEQIKKQEELRKVASDRLLSARERFGQLDESEQHRLIAIKQKADKQGSAALSREERAALRGVGTEGAEDLARQGDLLSAQRAGFDRVFGGSERAAIAAADAEKSRLELQVKAKREYIVKVEEDTEALVDRIAEQIETQLDAREQLIMDQVRQRLEQNDARRNNALRFSN